MQKGEQTRKNIISKAATLFNRKGFEGTSMQDVSAATGLEKGSLYTHFSNKEELAKEAFDFATEVSFMASVETLDDLPSYVDKIRAHIHNVASKPPFPGGCPMMNIAIDSNEGNAVLYDSAQRAFQQWVAFLSNLVEEGKRAGEIRESVEPEAFGTLLISLLEGACLASRLQNSHQALNVAAAYLNHYIDTAVVQAKTRPKAKRTALKSRAKQSSRMR